MRLSKASLQDDLVDAAIFRGLQGSGKSVAGATQLVDRVIAAFTAMTIREALKGPR